MVAIGSEKGDSFTIYCSITLVAAILKTGKETILARATPPTMPVEKCAQHVRCC